MRAARHNARVQQSFGYTLGRRSCVVVTLINVLAFLLFIFWWSPQYDSHLARLQRAYEPNVQDETLKISESKIRKIKIGGVVESRNEKRSSSLNGSHVRGGGVSSGRMKGVYVNGKDQLGPTLHFNGDGHEHVNSGKQLNTGKRVRSGGGGGGGGGSPVSRRAVKRNIIPFLRQVVKMVLRERDTVGPNNPLTRWIEQRCVHEGRRSGVENNNGAFVTNSTFLGQSTPRIKQRKRGQHQETEEEILIDVKNEDTERRRSLSSSTSSSTLKEKESESEPVCPHSLLDAQSDLRRWHGHSVLIPPDMLLDFTLNGSVPVVYEYSNDNDMIVVVERNKVEEKDDDKGGSIGSSSESSRWLEGADYFVGRRLVTAATLQKTYTDQIALMVSPYHYLSALPSPPSGGSDRDAGGVSNNNNNNNNGNSEVGVLDPAAPLSPSSLTSALSSLFSSYLMTDLSSSSSSSSSGVYCSKEENGEGAQRHARDNEVNAGPDDDSRQSAASSSSSSSYSCSHSNEMFLINPSASLLTNPYSGHSRLFAILSSLTLLTKGKEVAVLGSSDSPFVEVALLTLGQASRVHSIDYRPIFSSDRRIIGHDALEFWKRLTMRARRSWGLREAYQQQLTRDRQAKSRRGLEVKRVESGIELSESSASSNRRSAFAQQEETHKASHNKNQSIESAVLRVKNRRRVTPPRSSSEYTAPTLTSPHNDFLFVDDAEEEDREEYEMLQLDSSAQQQDNRGTARTTWVEEKVTEAAREELLKRNASPGKKKKKSPPPPIPNQPFDVVVAFSTFQHSGLGRYGDTLDPFGDVRAMADAWSILSEGGLLLLSVPVGNDCLVFNQYRVYGRRRLPLLLYGWEVVAAVGLEDRSVEELYYKVGRGSDSISRSYALSRAREQQGSILTRIARLVKRVLRWLFSRNSGGQGGSVKNEEKEGAGGESHSGSASSPAASDPSDHLEERYVSRWADGQCDGSLQNSPLFVLRKPVGGSSSSSDSQANYPYFKMTGSREHDGEGDRGGFDLLYDNGLDGSAPDALAQKTNAVHRDVSGHFGVDGDHGEEDDCTTKSNSDNNSTTQRGRHHASNCYLPSRIYGRRIAGEGEFRKSVKDSPTARIFTQKRTMKELRKIRGLLGSFPLFHRPR